MIGASRSVKTESSVASWRCDVTPQQLLQLDHLDGIICHLYLKQHQCSPPALFGLNAHCETFDHKALHPATMPVALTVN